MRQLTLSPDEFAQKLGFKHYERLLNASETVHEEGDISWFVTILPDGQYAAWDEAELALDRVEYFDSWWEAEDYQVAAVAQNIENTSQRFLFVLKRLEEILDRQHKKRICNHDGHCKIIPVLREFIESPEGSQTLDLFRNWYSDESPSELFQQLAGQEFISSNWIHVNELTGWLKIVNEADLEYAVR